jgi:hypothetical protein
MPEEIRREESPGRGPIYERIESRLGELRESRGYISWGAVWGGVMGAIGMEILLVLFGLFIYFVMFNPAAPGTGGARAWGAVWFLVTSFFSLLFGGWLSSRLAGSTTRRNGLMHGWVTWGLTSLGTWVIAVMTASPILTGLASIAGGAMAAAPQGAASMGGANSAAFAGSIAGNLVTLFLFWWIGTGLGFIGSSVGGAKGASEGPVPGRGVEAAPPGGRLAA